MSAGDRLLAATPILNFNHPSITQLIEDRGWKALSQHDRIGAVYDPRARYLWPCCAR